VALKGFLGLLLVLVVSVLVLAQRQDAGDVWDRFTDHLGLLSALKNQARCAGLCSELAFLIGHGVTLDRSLQLLRGQVSAQSRWGGVIAHIQQTLHQEGDIGQALDHPLLPSVVAQMAQVGSETGRLQQSLAYCAQWLEEGLEMEVDRLLQLLEPLLIAGCGMASGIVCVAAFLPIYGLLNGAQGQ
jgi:type IV pilus assembly protein PilC